MTAQPVAAAPRPIDLSGSRPVPMTTRVRVEMRKAVDTVASFWLVMAIVILTAIIDGFVLIASLVQNASVGFGDFASLSMVATALLLPIVAVMLVTSEWSQRTAMVTFSLEPRRSRVVIAKLLVGLLLTVFAWVVCLAVGALCTLISQVAQPDVTTWDSGGRQIVGILLAQLLAMLGGFALASLLLNTPAAIVVFLLYRFALPTILFVVSSLVSAFDKVSPYVNFIEAQGPLTDLTIHTGTQWAQLIVSGLLWVGLPMVFGVRRILRAEVK
jgi:ABC-type transport system involved in multi-copper enzyme maturation permease subunit